MPGDPFRHVRPGDQLQIPADGYNGAMDSARDFRRRIHNRTRGFVPASEITPAVIRVLNSTGGDLTRFGIIGLNEPIFLPATDAKSLEAWKNEPAMKGALPGAGYVAKWGILLRPVKDGAIGKAVVAGVCQCTVTVTDVNHLRAECSTSTTKLASSENGSALIVWRESGTGDKRAIVWIGFGESIGNPQYEGMAMIGVAQNERGWGWLPATPFDSPDGE